MCLHIHDVMFQGQHVQRHANWYDIIIQLYDITIRILRIDLTSSVSGRSNLAEGRHFANKFKKLDCIITGESFVSGLLENFVYLFKDPVKPVSFLAAVTQELKVNDNFGRVF